MKKTAKSKRRSLALSHRSFTGKKLPKQYTAYPILVFMLLCLGVLMASLTFKATAADVAVTAVAEGPPPPAPAIITSPAENDSFTSKPIAVKGTCPAGYIVKVYRNNLFSGSAMCQGGDTFEIQTDLFVGANLLQARIFNLIDEEGPTSPNVNVIYNPPQPIEEVPGPGVPQTPTVPAAGEENTLPLILKADKHFKAHYTGETVEWELELIGGQAPYAVSVEWGDGETTLISRKSSGLFKIRHVYDKEGGFRGNYPVIIKASDSANETALLQLSVLIKAHAELVSFAAPTNGNLSGAIPSLPIDFSFKFVWPLYGITLAMVLSFWLGSHQQYLKFLVPHK